MANRLKISFQELESRVRERTAELNTAKELAENANQTKDRFLARISHELRSPLNTIISYATILQEKSDLMPLQVKGLTRIRESGIHLLNLIEDILDFSKVQVGKIELNPTYLHWQSFLDGIVGMVEIQAQEKQLLFEWETVGKVATGIWVDEKRLRQVLINLLNNAIKFTEQGQVTLRVTVLEQIEEVFATPPFPQQKLRFEVIDTGIGISPEHLEKIFQPFEQVGISEQRAEGIGLGLAISRQIVEIMGSQIKVKSQLGMGSTFWFDISLPVTQVLPGVKDDGAVKALSPSGGKHKILVVDDKEENHFSLIGILKPLGFEVICVADGQQALEVAPSVRPNLILLDLFMPVKTGFTLVRELRKRPEFEAIPIILISASSYEVVQKASQHLGCEAFLTKPIDEKKLLTLLQEYGMFPRVFDKIN
jgi:signal transduction histidine kinase/ActR/RegA family two-component response regulator